MSFKLGIIFFLNKITYFKSLIYFSKKIFFSKEEKKIIKNKKNKIKNIFLMKTKNDKEILFNPVFGFEQIEFFEFFSYFLKIFELSNYKPTIFSSFKSYEIFNSANLNLKESLIFYADFNTLKNFNDIKEKLNSITDIINFKFNNIECGKFALSSTFRITRKGDINLSNKEEKKIFFNMLGKSMLNASGAINYLKNHNVESGVFIDKGYVGEGELMQAITLMGKKVFNFMNYYENNLLIIKKLTKENTNKHPGEIDDDDWEKLKKIYVKEDELNSVKDKIKKSYQNNEWYPSAGTVVGREFSKPEDITEYLGFSKKKKLAVVFNHIFWDASFFYGSDLFLHYQEWFYETYKIALKNKEVNWIFKLHPSNKTKNIRDNIKIDEPSEIKYIRKNFGKIPDHIKIIDEEFPFSSFNLYSLLDFCITVRGTTGLECALFEKPVITAGTGKYSNKGFTYDFENKEQYLKTLLNLPNLPDKKIDFLLARKYSYYALLKKPFKIEFSNVKFEKNISAKLKNNIRVNSYEDFINSNDVKKISHWIRSNENDNFI